MKTFKNNLPFECELEDINGNIHKLISKKLTVKDNNEMDTVFKDMRMLVGDKISNQLNIIFGQRDWSIFDINVLSQVLNEFNAHNESITKKK